MIDIHCHVLPGVDDGVQTLAEAVQMLKNAELEGMTDVILTPHYMKNGPFHKLREEQKIRFDFFKNFIQQEGLAIQLHLGNELYIHPQLSDLLENGKISTLADSDYVLIEFPFEQYKSDYDDILYDLRVMGYKVIIAHPERYTYVRNDYTFVQRWIDEGYLLQCNSTSLLSGNKASLYLMDAGAISFIASDAHNQNRPLSLKRAYEYVSSQYGNQVADTVFVDNPKRVLCNQNVEQKNIRLVHKKKKGLFRF